MLILVGTGPKDTVFAYIRILRLYTDATDTPICVMPDSPEVPRGLFHPPVLHPIEYCKPIEDYVFLTKNAKRAKLMRGWLPYSRRPESRTILTTHTRNKDALGSRGIGAKNFKKV